MEEGAPRAKPLVGGIELGGTKCVALLARDRDVVDELRLPTGAPGPTLDALLGWLASGRLGLPAAIGIASFGPLGLDPDRADYGRITTTPKLAWRDIDVVGAVRRRFAGPVGFHTDVTGAALAEQRWGAAAGGRIAAYLTIGTGVGGGLVVDGRPFGARLHPEVGHVRVRRDMHAGHMPGEPFAGVCPYHGDCLEGLISGPAIEAWTGAPPERLPRDHAVWPAVADALAEAMALLVLAWSPERLLIGGGVGLAIDFLLPAVRRRTAALLAGYVAGLDATALAAMVVRPGLGAAAGPLGAVALALSALEDGPAPAVTGRAGGPGGA